jgi:hypothetical protein
MPLEKRQLGMRRRRKSGRQKANRKTIFGMII